MMYYFIMLLIFTIINILVLGIGFEHPPFYAMQSILIPYNVENRRIILSNLLINYGIIMVFVMNILRSFHELFSMNPFILSRTNKGKSFFIYLKRVFKNVISLLIVKFIADLITGQINGILNVDIFILYYISSFITLFLWTLSAFLLYILKVGEKKIIFILLSSLFIIQYLSFGNKFLCIFVMATLNMLGQFWFWIILKLCVIIILVLINYKLFLKSEVIGGIKDD